MSQSNDNWSTSSNDALTVSLVTPSPTGIKSLASFTPKFTYPIFGDEEQVFGYQGLKINLRYNASDMRPHLAVSYSKKFKAIGDTEPANIEELIQPFLPQVAFQKGKDFEEAIKGGPSASWTPPGKLASSYSTNESGTYEIWKGSLASPAIKQLVTRLQILVSLFIEAGTPIDMNDPDLDRWTVYFLYRKKPSNEGDQASPYVFVGYCTVYRFFLYQPPPSPPASPAEDGPAAKGDLELGDGNFDLSTLPCRSRISQFIILPPSQGKGHGPKLYSSIFQDYLKHPQTVELTVEDPNEAFDDLRDLSDLTFLRSVPEFTALKIDTTVTLPADGAVPRNIVDPEAADALRHKVKIAPRQFNRVLEMHLMSGLHGSVRPGIDPESSVASPAKPTREQAYEYKLWRLLVKTRLYRQHKDTLGQFSLAERIEKLQETLGNVEFEYARLLAMHEARAQRPISAESSGTKRKVEDGEEASSSKKARVEEA